MTHRPRVPYDVWRQTLPTPMSKQRALRLASEIPAVVEGAKMIYGRWHVYADAPDPRMPVGVRRGGTKPKKEKR